MFHGCNKQICTAVKENVGWDNTHINLLWKYRVDHMKSIWSCPENAWTIDVDLHLNINGSDVVEKSPQQVNKTQP